MKKIKITRIALLTFLLCVMSSCLLVGTLARYTSTVSGSGKATVAAWSFKANGQTATIADVLLTDTSLNSKVTSGEIAPGTDGSFDITIDANGSDVAVDYTIAFSGITNKPANLKFYSDSSFATEITDLTAYTGLNGSIALVDIATAVTKTVYWKWDFGAVADDTADQGKAMSFTITVVGTQQDPTA